MRASIIYGLVRALLLKTFIKTLARQVNLKLTKFARRSRQPRAFFKKFAAGCDFLKQMSRYNWEVIQCARRCLKELARASVEEVSVYGERDIVEVLRDLTFEIPVRIKTIHESYEGNRALERDLVFLETILGGREKVIIASLVDIEEKMERLRRFGVSDERMVLLN